MINKLNQLNQISEKFKYTIPLIRSLFFDFLATSHFLFKIIHGKFFHIASDYHLVSKYARYPLICRANTTDIKVFYQIFIEQEYSCLKKFSDVNWIIDCGANVGYSSAYFLTCFPDSKVIAIEPDPDNFAILKKNLEPYQNRVKLIQSGIWSSNKGLKISETPYRDGKEWTRQVRVCHSDEIPDIQGIDLKTVIKEAQIENVSILKMDIEGAEAIVFADNYESWLPNIEKIVIELHDDTQFGFASNIFFKAIANRKFDISTSGELTICK